MTASLYLCSYFIQTSLFFPFFGFVPALTFKEWAILLEHQKPILANTNILLFCIGISKTRRSNTHGEKKNPQNSTVEKLKTWERKYTYREYFPYPNVSSNLNTVHLLQSCQLYNQDWMNLTKGDPVTQWSARPLLKGRFL